MKKLTLILISFITVLSSCSKKNDEPRPPMSNDSSGLAAYQMAQKLLYENGHPAFTFSGENDIYLASAATGNDGHKFIFRIINYINADWNGKDYVFYFSMGPTPLELLGKIYLYSYTGTLDEEGVYYKLVINLQNLTPYTLKIISEERAAEYAEEGLDVSPLPQP